MQEPWIGLFELLTPPCEFGDTRCFTHVLAWAETADQFAEVTTRLLADEGISVLSIEWSHPVNDYSETPPELSQFIDWIKKHSDGWLTSNRHYYPSKSA